MFSFAPYIDLSLVWGGLIATAILLYVLLDGFDLGIGIVFPFAPSDQCRDRMMNSIAPFWDGNETWLVLGGGGLFAAFPLAYAILMPALYIPVLLMLSALIFRGVAFEFRFKAGPQSRKLWDYAFHYGSLFAVFMQGIILGAFVQGVTVEGRAFAGGAFDWLTAFSLMTGIALIAGYILLGVTWVNMKTDGETQVWARKIARYILVYVIFFMAIVSLWVPFLENDIYSRWFSWPNILYLSPIPIAVLACTIGMFVSLKKHHDYWPFLLSVLLFFLGYIGLAISLWPWVVPYEITLRDAAAAPESLSLMLVGAVIAVPVILIYTAYCYYVFRGKTSHEATYY
jgi:cytochrome d ubiquinol oxidase subunit II